MNSCVQCGHQLGIGRFCINCGHPVGQPVDAPPDWRTDTVERPRVTDPPPEPVLPPPATDPPEAARFPLFADEAAPGPVEATPAPAPPRAEADEPHAHSHRHRRRGPAALLPWLLGLVVLALVAGLGVWLLVGGDSPSTTAEEAEPTAPADPDAEAAPSEPETSDKTDDGGRDRREKSQPTPRGRPENLAPFAAVSAPDSARPSTDTDGRTVQYVADNMVDDSPTTAWRMPGDGTGESITFRFDDPVRLRQVGLVNGYAKTASDSRGQLDWYRGNRRIREVEWTFDDGTVVTQRLRDTRDLQSIRVDRVDTESVTLRVLAVSPPGPGRASRNYTAISSVRLVGAPLG
ncbi:NADase-type glycan-binding domain-containing protein [Nocardioides coralli]|uniref:NADase-type glycan-binding domain-containing protein n=1 Tax=Nocardioides coralli TaxID=2872154 RepID=UPI001CA46D01|nr:hypothetical protein [Nocardioides coralli]QZY27987.1 hypothetical protein K6T13_10815 [Nocardioides coralli]